ncbi:MAG: hypothetical protein KDC54_05300 [Lewinella sp.]|nr:hypothetical protein [Lewinella sp.]
MSAAVSFETRTRQTTDALGNTIVSRSVYNRTTGRYETVQEIMVPYDYEITDIELANLEKIRYIMVRKNGQTGFISGEGGPVDPVMYDFVEAQSGRWRTRHFLVGRGERVGLLNENAAPVLPVVFSAIEVDQFTIKVTHPDDYIGYADWEGHVFLPIEIGE